MTYLIALLALLLSVPALAQTDHLECYKVRDTAAKAVYTADLAAVGLPADSGCRIKVPAKLLCVPAAKTNVVPPPPGGGGSGTPNAFACYQAKCPRSTLPALPAVDQFAARDIQPRSTTLLCAPLAPPVPTTTSTTTSTTTTMQACASSSFPQCNGACPPGDPPCQAFGAPGFDACRCPGVACGTYPTCGGPCPGGQVCVGFELFPGIDLCECQDAP
jgi:hypothetical protein